MTLIDLSDPQILKRVAEGDEAAMAELVRRHMPTVRRAAYEYGFPGAQGELEALAFAHVARHAAEARTSNVERWIFEVAERVARDLAGGHKPVPGVVRERPAYAFQPPAFWAPIASTAPDHVIVMGDYFQARRGFASDEALAAACAVDPERIRRIKRGADPDPYVAGLLGELAPVVRRLLDHYEPDAVPDWLLGHSPDLGGRRPIDALREGGLPDVLAALEAQTSGAFA